MLDFARRCSKGMALVVLMLSATAASANPYTYCGGPATRPGEMQGSLQPHMEGDPVYFMQDFQEIPKQPQFNEHKVWTNMRPWCHREDCEKYIKTLPEYHSPTMNPTRTCVEY